MSEMQQLTFLPNKDIFKINDLANDLYLIVEGTVVLLSADGHEIARIGSGESFGEQAFLKGGIRSATAKAVDLVTCFQLPRESIAYLLNDASPLLLPVFEGLLLQMNMNNELRNQTMIS